MINEAVELAKASDVAILVLGGNEKTVREEFSRTNLDLCGRQQQLLEAVLCHRKTCRSSNGRRKSSYLSIGQTNMFLPSFMHGFPGEFMGDAICQGSFRRL